MFTLPLPLRPSFLAAVCVTLSAPFLHAQEYAYSVTDLTKLGGTFCIASAVGNSGTVVGYAQFGVTDSAFTYNDGTLTNLGLLPNGTSSTATAISNSGYIAGVATLNGDSWGDNNLISYSGGVLSDLGVVPGGTGIVPLGVNDSGTVVGEYFDSSTPPDLHCLQLWQRELHLARPYPRRNLQLRKRNQQCRHDRGDGQRKRRGPRCDVRQRDRR